MDTKHRLVLDERNSLALNNVTNVDSFDDAHIELSGSFGGLNIDGDALKISALDLDAGTISIGGKINSLVYCASREEKKISHRSKKALSRLLK